MLFQTSDLCTLKINQNTTKRRALVHIDSMKFFCVSNFRPTILSNCIWLPAHVLARIKVKPLKPGKYAFFKEHFTSDRCTTCMFVFVSSVKITHLPSSCIPNSDKFTIH